MKRYMVPVKRYKVPVRRYKGPVKRYKGQSVRLLKQSQKSLVPDLVGFCTHGVQIGFLGALDWIGINF